MRLSRFGLVVTVLSLVVPAVGAVEPTIRMDEIQRVIRESEYHVSWQEETVLPDLDGAWHATNRAQNLRFYFTDDGLRVLGRTAVGGHDLLRLRVAADSVGEAPPFVEPPSGRELSIHHSHVTETFVNEEGGLRHVVTVNSSPAGDQPAVIELDWSAAGMAVTDRSVVLRTASGRRLVYSIDQAMDATGSPIEATLSPHGGRILLTFGAGGSAYPITVKNILTGTADTVLEGNVLSLSFGEGVAAGDLNGDGFADVVALNRQWDGGQASEGAVMIFHGGPGGIPSNGTGAINLAADTVIESNGFALVWPRVAAVVDDLNGDGFNELVVGDWTWDSGVPPGTMQHWGAVWIFEGSAAGITATSLAEADTFIESDITNAMVGNSIGGADVNGDGFGDLIVGARWWSDDATQGREGGVFIFHGSAAGISASSVLEAQTIVEGNSIHLLAGDRVAGLGDVNGDGFDDVAVSMPDLDHPEDDEGGIAILYGGAAGIASNPTAQLSDAAGALIEGNMVDLFLSEVAGAGDVNGDGYNDVLIGAPDWDDSLPTSPEGAVAIYHGGASGISSNGSVPFLDVADTAIEGNQTPHALLDFGTSVASVGDCNGDGFGDVAAGIPNYANPEVNEGAYAVFFGRAGGIPSARTDPFQEVADLVIEGDLANLFNGHYPIAGGDVNGDGFTDLVLPAPFWGGSGVYEGAVLVYHGAADTFAGEADAAYDGQIADEWLGISSSSAGDLNGDGYDDFVVGVPLHDGASSWLGRVHLFLGSPAPSLSTPDWTYDGQFWIGETGWSVASAGDVNGDGYGDLAVGTPDASNPEIEEGRVDVFFGSASGLSSSPDWSFEPDSDDEEVGAAVASAGDVNGDGYGDLIVGAPSYSNIQFGEGRAYVFHGSPSGLTASPVWTFEIDVASAQLGRAVASAGDVNGDGFGDILVGAPAFENGETREGAAYGFRGSATGLSTTPYWVIETNRANSDYGHTLASAGDVNNDGYSDVIVGALTDSNIEQAEGRAYVYHGSASGLSTAADRVLEMNRAGAYFGSSVDSAGDVNGDGFSDVIVGAVNDTSGTGYEGRAYLFLGGGAGIASQPSWYAEGANQDDSLGVSVAGVGDHNGDGFSDVVVGVMGSDAGAVDGGSVELYLGNTASGRQVMARQLRGAGDPTPVQPWGLTRSGDDFQVSMTATSPWGRELAKLHVEACPTGKTWGDVECRHQVSASWTPIPLGENGATLTETLSGLTEDTLYHWRAHVLYLPLNADQPGITEPPVPRYGPWRTLSARASAADIRVGEPQSITIEMVTTASSVGEGAIQAEVEIVMTTSDGAVSQIDCSVDADSFDQTAIAAEDYVAASSNALFPSGTASGAAQVVVIDLIDDTLDEPDEDFGVELSNPTGGVLGAQTAHVVTIVDDDPPPELSAVDVLVGEGAGSAIVTLELSAPTAFEMTVAYATADGTATASADYDSVSGNATIAPLDTTLMVDIPIVADGLDEIDESFTLELTGASNATLMSPTVAVTILDDDPPPELSAVDIQVDEHDGVAVVTLELSGPTSFEVTADYSTTDGSATAPADYEPVSGTATIPPLATQTTVEIPIVNDCLEESLESFFLELTGPVNAALMTPSVEVTILDNDAGIIFADGFESAGTGSWSSAAP